MKHEDNVKVKRDGEKWTSHYEGNKPAYNHSISVFSINTLTLIMVIFFKFLYYLLAFHGFPDVSISEIPYSFYLPSLTDRS